MNKYLTRILIVFAVGLIFSMCGKDDEPEPLINPLANFTITGGDKPAHHKVVLTNTSTNATAYEWDFGDGTTSTVTSPNHVYQEEGTYTISLTAKNGSLQNIKTKTVTIMPAPTQLKMTQLTLTAYPETNDTIGWDVDNGKAVICIHLLSRFRVYYDPKVTAVPIWKTIVNNPIVIVTTHCHHW